jgi:ribosomal protein S18 acetylase RimI-like enzyme
MADSITVRPARADDLSKLADFAAALAAQHREYNHSRFVVPSREVFYSFFNEQLTDPIAIILVAEKDHTVLGYAFLRLEPPSLVDLTEETFWLHDIYVQPTARGHGVGQTLLQKVVDVTRQRGRRKILLKVSPKNDIASHAFATIGFRPTMTEMQLDL